MIAIKARENCSEFCIAGILDAHVTETVSTKRYCRRPEGAPRRLDERENFHDRNLSSAPWDAEFDAMQKKTVNCFPEVQCD